MKPKIKTCFCHKCKFGKLYRVEAGRLLTLVYGPLANQEVEHNAL